MTTPFWSVMMPVYRPDAFFEEALQSVLAQAPEPGRMQIEVVNDCPADTELEERVRRVAGDRVKFSTNERNLGLTGNWNRCIERARGRWIHLLHQDDRVYPGFYDSFGRTIARFPEAGAAFCANDLIDLEGNILPDEDDRILQPREGLLEDAVPRLCVANLVQCPAVVVARSTYEKIGRFDPRFLFAVDWEMWVRIAHHLPIAYLPRVLASYRVHPGSETSSLTRSGETVRDCFRAIDSFSRYLPRDRRRKLKRRATEWAADMAYSKAHDLLMSGQVDWAMALFRPALSRERRPNAWRNAAILWRHAIRLTHRPVLPPLPIFPQSWFRAR